MLTFLCAEFPESAEPLRQAARASPQCCFIFAVVFYATKNFFIKQASLPEIFAIFAPEADFLHRRAS